jgi:hypothetical protein
MKAWPVSARVNSPKNNDAEIIAPGAARVSLRVQMHCHFRIHLIRPKTQDDKRGQVTGDTISRFNRDTVWLTTGVLGTVIFAALVLAVQEHQPKATQAERDLLLNANPATVASVLAKTEPVASTHVLALTPENRNDAQANPDSRTLARRQDSARAIGPQFRNARNRSSVASRSVDVKRRLIELWHESLARSEKSRSWTAFSNLTSGAKKKAAYTAEKNH